MGLQWQRRNVCMHTAWVDMKATCISLKAAARGDTCSKVCMGRHAKPTQSDSLGESSPSPTIAVRSARALSILRPSFCSLLILMDMACDARAFG